MTTAPNPTNEEPADSRPAADRVRFIWTPTNIGLALLLAAECTFGMYSNRDDRLDMMLWLVVGTILVFNTVRRSPAFESDSRWWVWIVCGLSTLHILAFESEGETQAAYWTMFGIYVLADTSLIALGRSFSLMPARRTIRVGWMYRCIRHPIYSAYIVIDAIYVAHLPTLQNFVVLYVGAALFAWRASLEERLLRNDPRYREYAEQTRWRFLPFVY